MLDKEKITLPALPGFKSSAPQKRGQSFNRAQTLQYKNGYRVDQIAETLRTNSPASASSRVTEADIQHVLEKANDLRFGGRVHFLPPKVTLEMKAEAPLPLPPTQIDPRVNKAPMSVDEVVLRFEGYVKEQLPPGVRIETAGGTDTMIRRMVISYYMKDGTIAVTEPLMENSGLPQGSVLKRERIPKSGQYGTEPYTIYDFQLGKDIVFYGRAYHICSCDQFTENYVARELKHSLGKSDGAVPPDSYLQSRLKNLQIATADTARHVDKDGHDKLRKFIEDDKKVLRFFCTWEVRLSEYQTDISNFEVHYYLLDDTIEVRPVKRANSGLDAFPILIRRQKLPKHMTGMEDLASTTPIGAAAYSPANSSVNKFYNWRDFHVGQYVEMLGRQFFVYDVDGFTRNFYVTRGQRSAAEMMPVTSPTSIQRTSRSAAQQSSKPSNDGAEDEFLKPQSRRPNIFRMLQNEGKVLRFAAQFAEGVNGPVDEYDANRRFIINYRLADDIMSIYETPNKAAGIASGKFMERGTPIDPVSHNYYEPNDLFVGAQLTVHGRVFRLIDADEFALNYMETHATQFPKANYPLIVNNLRGKPDSIATFKSMLSPDTKVHEAAAMLASAAGISVHEAMTVVRKFSSRESGKVNAAVLGREL